MYYAWVIETPNGFFAHKVFAETEKEAEKRVRAGYAGEVKLHHVHAGAKDQEDCGHSLYDRAIKLAGELEAKKPKPTSGLAGLFE